MKKPKISVIVPVYNREKLIKRCIDSILSQTLQGIEIICVDDGSTDNSLEILKYYEKNFSTSIKVYSIANAGAANARNYGVRHALGEYITFVDSDDYIDYFGLERMYQTAIEKSADFVCAPLYKVENFKCKILYKYNGQDGDIEELLKQGSCNLYNKIIHRSLIEKLKLQIPNFRIGEDTAYMYTILSWAKNPVYCGYPYYYYELSENSVSAESYKPWIIKNIREVEEWIFKNANPLYQNILEELLVQRVVYLFNTNPNHADEIMRYLNDNKYKYLYKNKFIKTSDIEHKIFKIMDKKDYFIPHNIIINNIYNQYTTEEISSIQNIAFYEDGDIKEITQNDLEDIKFDCIKEALKKQDIEFLGVYFALKYIYEYGGIYIRKGLEIKRHLNQFQYDGTIFCYKYFDNISYDFFGSSPKNIYINKILNFIENSFYSSELLQTAFNEIIIRELGIGSRNKSIITKDNIYVYNSGYFLVPNGVDINYIEDRVNKAKLTEKLYLESFQRENSLNIHINNIINERTKLEYKIICHRNEIDMIRKSEAFYIGHCLVFIPHKFKRGLQCISDHGIKYTLMLCIKKAIKVVGG